MNTNLNLVNAWNTLWGQLTSWAPGIGTFLGVIGLGIIAWFIGKWAWSKRRGGGGGAGGFPVAALVFGLLLAGPTIVIPIILSILQVLFVVVASAISWVVATLP